MANPTPEEIKKDLKEVFEIFKWFVNLNESYQIKDVYFLDSAMEFVEQMKEGLLKKREDIKKKMDDAWLMERLEANLKTVEAKGFDHRDFWEFRKRFQNIRDSLERKLKAMKSKQKWVDERRIIEELKSIDLEEVWEKHHGEVTSSLNPHLHAALRKLVKS